MANSNMPIITIEVMSIGKKLLPNFRKLIVLIKGLLTEVLTTCEIFPGFELSPRIKPG